MASWKVHKAFFFNIPDSEAPSKLQWVKLRVLNVTRLLSWCCWKREGWCVLVGWIWTNYTLPCVGFCWVCFSREWSKWKKRILHTAGSDPTHGSV